MSSSYEIYKITLFALITSWLLGKISAAMSPFPKFAYFDLDIPHFHRIHTMPYTESQNSHGPSHC